MYQLYANKDVKRNLDTKGTPVLSVVAEFAHRRSGSVGRARRFSVDRSSPSHLVGWLLGCFQQLAHVIVSRDLHTRGMPRLYWEITRETENLFPKKPHAKAGRSMAFTFKRSVYNPPGAGKLRTVQFLA